METPCPNSYSSEQNWSAQHSRGGFTRWTRVENKLFEIALAVLDQATPDRWSRIAAMIPGKTVDDVMKKYKELEEDVRDIEEGIFSVSDYLSAPFTVDQLLENQGVDEIKKRLPSAGHERKKGVPWTEEEHRRFLMGLLKHGKGDWRNISRNFVISKTATQVASHAQKYFQRQEQQASSGGKEKKRPSIHDITTVSLTVTAHPTIPSDGGTKPNSPHLSSQPSPCPAHLNFVVSSQREAVSHGIKLMQANGHHGAYGRPRNHVLPIQAVGHQVRG